jgi:hypothetical protein
MERTTSGKPRYWYKILGIFLSCLVAMWFNLPDLRQRLATIELFALFLFPLIIFYLRNSWSLGKSIRDIVLISILIVFSYSILHESSHVVGVYLIGPKPVEVHLIPKYWEGNFTTAASVSSEPVNSWLGVIPGLFPYIKDIFFLIIGFLILRRKRINNSFVAGFIYAFFCLTPLFDIVNNYLIKLIVGRLEGNDFYGVALGWGTVWANVIGMTFSIFAIFICIRTLIFYKGFPMIPSVDNAIDTSS